MRRFYLICAFALTLAPQIGSGEPAKSKPTKSGQRSQASKSSKPATPQDGPWSKMEVDLKKAAASKDPVVSKAAKAALQAHKEAETARGKNGKDSSAKAEEEKAAIERFLKVKPVDSEDSAQSEKTTEDANDDGDDDSSGDDDDSGGDDEDESSKAKTEIKSDEAKKDVKPKAAEPNAKNHNEGEEDEDEAEHPPH